MRTWRGERMGKGRAWVVLAACVIGAWADAARAQFGSSMGFGWTDPPFTRREVKSYARVLDLDEMQAELARSLVEGNRAAHQAMTEQYKDERKRLYEKCRETGNWDAWGPTNKRLELDRMRQAEELESAFLTDLRALLTSEQGARFEAVERQRRREVMLKYALVTGMSDDVFTLLESAGVTPAEVAAHRAVLDEYATRLDEVLVRLERRMKEIQKKFVEDDQRWDFERIVEAFRPLEEMGRNIRDLHRSTLEQVSSGLSEEKRTAMAREAKHRAFPKLYRETHAQKAIAAARALADLTPLQRDAIGSLAEQFERKHAESDRGFETLFLDVEREYGGRLTASRRGGWWWGGTYSERYEELRKARSILERETVEKLEKLLEPEQVSRLPSRSPDPKNDGRGPGEEWGWTGLGEEDEGAKS